MVSTCATQNFLLYTESNAAQQQRQGLSLTLGECSAYKYGHKCCHWNKENTDINLHSTSSRSTPINCKTQILSLFLGVLEAKCRISLSCFCC
jgi:hypothetical protein